MNAYSLVRPLSPITYRLLIKLEIDRSSTTIEVEDSRELSNKYSNLFKLLANTKYKNKN